MYENICTCGISLVDVLNLSFKHNEKMQEVAITTIVRFWTNVRCTYYVTFYLITLYNTLKYVKKKCRPHLNISFKLLNHSSKKVT